MAGKTIVDKAGLAVGIGIAAASDVAGAIKTAFDAAVTTVGGVLKKAPAKQAAKKAVTKKAAKKATKTAVVKKTAAKKTVKKAVKKVPAKKTAKKSVKTPGKQAGRVQR